jgi:hypothetical protein
MFKSDKDLRKAVPKKIVPVASRGVSTSQKPKQLLSIIPQKSEKNNFDYVEITKNDDAVSNSFTKDDNTSRTHTSSSSSSSTSTLNIIDITKQEREKRMKMKQSISSSIKIQSWWRLIYYHHRYYQNLLKDIQNKLTDIEKLYLLLFQQKSILFVSPIHVIDSLLLKYIILQRYSFQYHYHHPHYLSNHSLIGGSNSIHNGSDRSSQKSSNSSNSSGGFGDMELLIRLCKYLLLPSINASNYEKNILYYYHHHRDDGMRLLKSLFFLIIKNISNYYYNSNNTSGGMNSKSNNQVIKKFSNDNEDKNSSKNNNNSSNSSSSLFLKEELSILVDTLSALIGLEAPYKMKHTSELSSSYNILIHHLMVDNKYIITIRHCCLSIIYHQLSIHSVDNYHSKTLNNNHESSVVVCSQLFNIVFALNNYLYIKSNDNSSCRNIDDRHNINSSNGNNSNLFSSLLKFDITSAISTGVNKEKQEDKEDEDKRMKLFVQYIFSIPMLTIFLSSQKLTDFCSSLYFLQLLSVLLSSETILSSSSTTTMTASTETFTNDNDNIRNRKMNMNDGNEYLSMQTIKSGLWILGNLLSLLPCLLELIESRKISIDILSRYIHVSSIWFERFMPCSFLQGKNNIIWHKTQSSNIIAVALPYGLEKQLLTVYKESVMLMLLKLSLFNDYVSSNSNNFSRCTDNNSNVNRYDDDITDINLDWYINESDMKEISESLQSSSYAITSTTLQHDVESSTWLTAKWAKKIVNNLFSNFSTKKSYTSTSSSSSSSMYSSSGGGGSSNSKLKDVSLNRDQLQLLHSICKLWGNIMPNASCSNIDTLQWKSISFLSFTNNSIVISRLWYVLFNQLCHHDINKLIDSYLLSYKSIHQVLLTTQTSSSSLSQWINVHKDSTDDVLNILVTLLSFLRVSLIALDDSELYDCGVRLF